MALPVAGADAVRERGHPVEHGVHLCDDVHAVDDERRTFRHAQRDVQSCAVLGDVDVVAPEHRLRALREPGLLGELDEEPQRLVRDAVLRVVEVEAGALGDQPLSACGSSPNRSRRWRSRVAAWCCSRALQAARSRRGVMVAPIVSRVVLGSDVLDRDKPH